MTVRINVHSTLAPQVTLDSAADAYIATFSQPPYSESEEDRAGFLDRVERYARRDGFALALASEGDAVVGLALAVTAHPGDWWRDQVAANLSATEIDEWLGHGTLELVHVAVVPSVQGHGVGGRLLDAISDASVCRTGILTVDSRAEPARRLYASRGWSVLREVVTIGQSTGAILMGKRLRR
jgi:GNAT superfamily N-acetyltransferase